MKRHRSKMWLKLAGALLIAVITIAANSIKMVAQQTTQSAVAAVPTVVQFSGVLRDETGKPLTGTVGVTFLLYKDEQGGAPLWLETQNVQPDKSGRYTVMLGSTSISGLPNNIFVAGEARWLAVQAQGQPEQPRVMLLSVPYALKAGDAETLGGLPVSAFALASSNACGATSAGTNGNASSASTTSAPSTSSNVTTTGGTVSDVPLWTTATNIQSSALTQTGTGSAAKIGINTNTPAATFDVKGSANVEGPLTLPATGTATATAGKNSQPQGFIASSFNSSSSKATAQTFQWQAEAASNDTSNPGGTLNLLFGSGTNKPAETGLRIGGNGQITFASGQTFPGTGTGTITSVTAGTDLTGGGSSGNVALNVDTTRVVTGLSAGVGLVGGGTGGVPTLSVDPTQVPLLNAANNTFNGNQNVNGNLTILNNANYQPLFVQSSSTFGTWLSLNNTSTGGKQWSILSAGGANAEGAGGLGITNFTGNSNIYLEGNVHANTLSVNNDTPMSSSPHMAFSGFIPGNLGNGPYGGYFVPDRNITITRISSSTNSPGRQCTYDSSVLLVNSQGFTIIAQLDLGYGNFFVDSGQLTVAVSAGTEIVIKGYPASGCTTGTSASDVFVNVQYVMR